MSDIVFVSDAVCELQERWGRTDREHVFLLTDENVYHCCPFLSDPSLFLPENRLVLKPGEGAKSLEGVAALWQLLSSRGARRNSLLVNVGGGVVTDMGGFAAACFKRGMRYINIPTTLLAQIDASVGGKTGVNFNGLKNEIGAFALPECVIIDNTLLKTLPPRQLLSGFAEMLKHALLSDPQSLRKLFTVSLSCPESPDFLSLIEESVAVKKRIVAADPQEHGIRKTLNFGHTVGHAIESVALKCGVELYHGEAVAYGLLAELDLSVRCAGFQSDTRTEISRHIRSLYPPYKALASNETLYELMCHDKKNDREGVNFTLLHSIGEASIDNYCSRQQIIEALNSLQEYE